MEDDPFAAKPKAAPALDLLSIEELEARIESLKAEIATCAALVEKKRSVRAAADAMFGAKPS